MKLKAFPPILFILIAVLVPLATGLAFPYPVLAQDIPIPSEKDEGRVQAAAIPYLEATNEFVRTAVSSGGQFVTGTTGGDPNTANDDNRRLLYGYPDYIGTSFSTLRIIGNGIESDYALGEIIAPTEAPVLDNNLITTVWVLDGVRVTQRLYLSLNSDTNRNDTTTIEYEIRNNNNTNMQVGVRMMLDTMIGGNDGAPFFILGAGQVTQEFEWTGSGVPAYWIAYESPTFATDSLKGRGQLIGANLTKPDRFVVSDWPDAVSSIWDYQVNPADAVTLDSAVILYYNPVDVAPGATRVIRTSYGIARSGASQQVELVGLEVTQGIQNWNNEVALIQDRPTYVRAHVQSTAGTANGISAELHGRRNGVALPNSPLQPSNAGGRINVLQTPQRGNLGDAFYFELPQAWLNGTVELEFKGVGREIVCRESAGDDNDCTVSLGFTESRIPEVRFVGIPWSNGSPNSSNFEEVERQLEAALPIPYLNSSIYSPPEPSTTPTPQPGPTPVPPPSSEDDFSRLLIRLSETRELDGCSSECNRFYIGVVVNQPQNSINGMAYRPGYVSAGYITDRYTHPHEFGHSVGLPHVRCTGSEGSPGAFPYTDGLIGGFTDPNREFWGIDLRRDRVFGPQSGDLMSYCTTRWTSDFTYTSIQSALRQRYDSATAAAEKLMILEEHPAILVSGVVSLTQWGGELTTFYTVPSPSATSAPSPGSYAIEFRNALGQRLAIHEFAPEEPSEGTVGSFTLLLPFPEGATQILLLRNGHTLDVVNASNNAPTVALISPNGGEVLTGQTATTSWVASDQDNDPLTYVVQYSADAGATWQTLVVDWSQTSYPLNLSQIAGGNSSIIRILASDGFHTISDQSDGAFSVSPKAPQVTIDAPSDQSFYVADQLVLLRGTGYDTEDGQLVDDSNYAWSSSIDGALGSGRSLAVNASLLSEGGHDVMLTLTDSDGLTTSKEIQITVFRDRPVMPATWSVTPSDILFQAIAVEASPDPQVLILRNAGDGTVQWNASADRDWILLSSLSGNLPVDILVGVNTTSLSAGTYTGTITFNSSSIAQPQIIPVTLEVTDRNAAEMIASVSQPVIPADGASGAMISIQIRDAAGRPVPNQVITFTTSLGEIVNQATTNLSGVAEANLTSSTVAGLAEVRAQSGHLQDIIIVNFVAGPPANITLTAAPTSLLADGASTAALTAVVKDANGNPVPNQTVTFATTLGAITNAAVTNADGVATATLTSAQQVGVAQVTASLGALSASTEVTFAGSVFAGVVFVDRNQNGVRDAGEPGIPNVTAEMTLVSLAASSEQAATAAVGATWRTVSDAEGKYRFTELPLGDYTLTLYFPRGYAATTPTAYTVTVGTGQNAAPEVGALVKVYLPAVRR